MWERELAFAEELADDAAGIAMSIFRGDVEVTIKPDQTPVTQADMSIETAIRERIAREFPNDRVLGEEQGGEEGPGRLWVIDPIDGTRNFADGIQVWATLIALVSDGDPVMSVVSAPALGERYAAAEGGGATLNGEAIRVSERPSIEDAHIVTGDVEAWYGTDLGERLQQLESRARRRRGFGDFWGHMLVARGSADVMVEPELAVWDYSALVPIVTESGGRCTQVDGSALAHKGSILTTNGRLHADVLAALSAE